MNNLTCNNCSKEIKDTYYKCLDNFLQVKYFDSDEYNVFCSERCFSRALFLTEIFKES